MFIILGMNALKINHPDEDSESKNTIIQVELSKKQGLISQTTIIIYYHYNYVAINIQ